MKVYIAGPMSGKEKMNKPAFERARQYVESWGSTENKYEALSPFDIAPHEHPNTPCPASYASAEGEHSAACYLRTDLIQMLQCDEVWVLPGWESSIGARLEIQVAATCGLPVKFISTAVFW